MRLALLHTRGRDSPDRLVEVDFAPFGLPHLAPSLGNMRRELQRQLRDELARIALDPPQTSERNRIGFATTIENLAGQSAPAPFAFEAMTRPTMLPSAMARRGSSEDEIRGAKVHLATELDLEVRNAIPVDVALNNSAIVRHVVEPGN